MQIRAVDNIFIRIHQANRAKADLWFVHGFGGSGLCFREAFASVLAKHFNLFVPDCPGFGASPAPPKPLSIEATARILSSLVQKISGSNPLGIIAHSLGGPIGTWLCQKWGRRVVGFINIEGNLTRADCFYSGKAKDFDSAEKFYAFFTKEILARVLKNPASQELKRFYADLCCADPSALYAWGKSGLKATGIHRAGDAYAGLKCKTLYLWGAKSAPQATRAFILSRNLNNKCFKNSGHCPMMDAASECYQAITRFFASREIIF